MTVGRLTQVDAEFARIVQALLRDRSHLAGHFRPPLTGAQRSARRNAAAVVRFARASRVGPGWPAGCGRSRRMSTLRGPLAQSPREEPTLRSVGARRRPRTDGVRGARSAAPP
jgi:hypothetical protein